MSFIEKSSGLSISVEKGDIHRDINEKSSGVKDNLLWQKITFVVIGISALNVWNFLLQMKFKKTEYYAFQLTGLIISSITNIYIGAPRFLLLYFLGGLICSAISLQMFHFFLSEEVFIYGYSVSFFLIGLCAGFSQSIAFSIASSMKTNLSGFISGGFGISGIFTFIFNLILDYIVNDKIRHTINSQKLLICYIVCELCIVLTMILCVKTLPLSNKSSKALDAEALMEEEERSLSSFEIIKDISRPLISIFIVNFLTTNLFPIVGPIKWAEKYSLSELEITVIIGMFQIFDFVGRYLPNLSDNKVFRFLIFSSKYLLQLSILRFVFIAIFIYIAVFVQFNNTFLMCIIMSLFALTNGWFITLSFINFVPDMRKSKTKKDNSIAANYMVFAMFLGLCCGIWSSLIYSGMKL